MAGFKYAAHGVDTKEVQLTLSLVTPLVPKSCVQRDVAAARCHFYVKLPSGAKWLKDGDKDQSVTTTIGRVDCMSGCMHLAWHIAWVLLRMHAYLCAVSVWASYIHCIPEALTAASVDEQAFRMSAGTSLGVVLQVTNAIAQEILAYTHSHPQWHSPKKIGRRHA